MKETERIWSLENRALDEIRGNVGGTQGSQNLTLQVSYQCLCAQVNLAKKDD